MTNGQFLKLEACPVVTPVATLTFPQLELPCHGQCTWCATAKAGGPAERLSTKVSCGTSAARAVTASIAGWSLLPLVLGNDCRYLGIAGYHGILGLWADVFGTNHMWAVDNLTCESGNLKTATVNVQNGRVWGLLDSPDLYGCGQDVAHLKFLIIHDVLKWCQEPMDVQSWLWWNKLWYLRNLNISSVFAFTF